MKLGTLLLTFVAVDSTLALELPTGMLVNPQDYVIEYGFLALIILLIYFYLEGRKRNNNLLNRYLSTNFGFFAKSFSYVGMGITPTDDLPSEASTETLSGQILEQDTPNFYRIYWTGRASVKFAIVNISLQRRQDLIMSTVYSLLWPEKDRVLVEVALEDSALPRGIFYLLRNKNVKKCMQEYEDLKSYCKKYKADLVVAPTLSIFGENDNIVDFICDKTFSEAINRYADIIESIEMTDCIASELHKGMNAKICLSLGKGLSEDCEKVLGFTRAFFGMIDRVAAYVPPKKYVEELESNRKSFAAKKERERREQTGDNKGSREERIAKMTPAERKKFEEKEEKRMKARMNKMVKVVKK
jgi:hypothetical protein